MTSLSIGDPISSAWARMKLVCFQPFDLGKWLALGFCAWLATLGEGFGGGGGGGGNGDSGSGGSGGGDPKEALREAWHWFADHWLWLTVGAVVVLAVIVGLVVVGTWLKSRGEFMFIDGIARNRGAVKEPWHAFREQAYGLMGFRLAFTAITGVLGLLVVGGGLGLVAWAVIGSEAWILGGLGIGLIVLVMVPIAIAAALISWLLDTLVVPAMYARGVGVMEGWRILRGEMLPGNAGSIVLFLLIKILLGAAAAAVALVAILLTCCIAMIPYVGTVLLLPVAVFIRSVDLYFVEQFGEEFRIIKPVDDGPSGTAGPVLTARI